MAVELLHERLVVMPDPESVFPPERPIRPMNTPSITIRMKSVPSLMELLSSTDGSSLTSFTKALFFHEAIWFLHTDSIRPTVNVVEALLRHLVNVKELILPCPDAPMTPQHLRLEIPHFTCLTHLHLTTTSFEEAFEVLRFNPSLRVVVVTMLLIDVVRPGTNLRLPNLRCYTGPGVTWPFIVEASPQLENLGGLSFPSEPLPNPDLYSNMRAINLTVSQHEPSHPLFPYLRRVEYLRILSTRPSHLSNTLADAVRRIPSPSLKYVCIRSLGKTPTDTTKIIADSLLKGFPSLKIVDIVTIIPFGKDLTPLQDETIRYTRDSIPSQICLPRTDIFGCWWYDIQHEFEAMVRSGHIPIQDTGDPVTVVD
ncbi:hypothetical protein ONZ45_g19304 [Pleurotus djamor]|nr:hypothetical protein ONZ45_g19304 [Pleurotus djamor]